MARVAVYKVMWRNKKTKAESTDYVVVPHRWVDPKTKHQHDGGELLATIVKNTGLVFGDVEFVSRDIVVPDAFDGSPEPTKP